jgi:adenine-specific DNA methylase
VQPYGILQWGELFTDRQIVALTTLVKYVNQINNKIDDLGDRDFKTAVQTCLAFLVNKMTDKASSLCRWKSSAEYMAGNTFGRQALPMVWDFCEASMIGKATGDIGSEVEWISQMLEHGSKSLLAQGKSERCSATNHPLPDDSVSCFFSDPPYYDAVPYADLSDFFYVWLKRTVPP